MKALLLAISLSFALGMVAKQANAPPPTKYTFHHEYSAQTHVAVAPQGMPALMLATSVAVPAAPALRETKNVAWCDASLKLDEPVPIERMFAFSLSTNDDNYKARGAACADKRAHFEDGEQPPG